MTESMRRADDADKQRAFLGLLSSQVVTPWSHPALYPLVHRHAATLTTWCGRLDYRLVHLDRCYRLRRVPLDGGVAVPDGEAPRRAVLLLTLYAAACLDDHHEDAITLQELSDVVRLATAGLGRWPYDPNLRPHRQSLIAAVRLLVGHGVLEPRTDEQLVEGWERSGEGIGAGYLLHRDALMMLIDTGDVDLALARRGEPEDDTRGVELLRALVETQAILVDELPESSRAYLSGQRTRLASRAEEMTGGSVEIRSDAITLVLPADRDLPADLQVDFPSATTVDWVSLHLLEGAAREDTGSFRVCPAEKVRRLATDLHASSSRHLTKALQESPSAVLVAAQERLTALGLLHVLSDGAWRLTPLAGRYRDADLSIPDDPLFPEDA
ncbi:DUF2398 family protein [Propionicicella superfundia]|uniref:DUF2398 family protein n=1 Tax=Propionicicella superfundia TaxID=348582 RepID=UPI0004208776|nr:DUF2398 family protein [Propionicicella superfundia]